MKPKKYWLPELTAIDPIIENNLLDGKLNEKTDTKQLIEDYADTWTRLKESDERTDIVYTPAAIKQHKDKTQPVKERENYNMIRATLLLFPEFKNEKGEVDEELLEKSVKEVYDKMDMVEVMWEKIDELIRAVNNLNK